MGTVAAQCSGSLTRHASPSAPFQLRHHLSPLSQTRDLLSATALSPPSRLLRIRACLDQIPYKFKQEGGRTLTTVLLGQIPYKSKSEARDHTVEFRLLKTGVPKFPSLFYIWSDLFDSFSRDNSALTWCNVMQWRHALIYLYVAMELTSDAEHLTLSTSISKFWKIPK
jgi:hypothetical protein